MPRTAVRRAPRRKMVVTIPRSMAPVRRRKLRSSYNPSPTFTETVKLNDIGGFVSTAGTAEGGGVFKLRISDIPQYRDDYANLYTQYRINSVKYIVLPQFDTQEANTAVQNQAQSPPYSFTGMARVAWAVQDSPNVGDPASEAEVLQDNGAKVRAFGSKWVVTMKPTPDVSMTTSVGVIPTRARKSWFNYDAVTTGNNPQHGSIQWWISQLATTGSAGQKYSVYAKINFSLRDAK